MDRRSSEAHFLRRVRKEMTAHVGGKPSATQRVLIDRIAWLRLRIAAMESRTGADGIMGECATHTYLAWTGTLSRLMKDLGPAVPLPDDKPATLKAHLARQAVPA